ncbi:MAG: outer membrane lipoprotein carrier protein LolA [Nitrospira sp.]|nr:outer membrane lipoprotein carrier protein LolA [Nitrospira sp.]
MIIGTNTVSLILSGCLLLSSAQAVGANPDPSPSQREPPSTEWTVEQVAASLKEEREPSVVFEEETYSSLLTKPIVARGVLRFSPPSRLEKDVLEPSRERYVVEGDVVTFESERKQVKRTISLDDYPALRGFVEAFRAGVTGDAALLKRHYETALSGNRRQWVLQLRPRDPAGKTMLDSIQFSGSEGRIDSITIRLPDGDRSVMRLSRGHMP